MIHSKRFVLFILACLLLNYTFAQPITSSINSDSLILAVNPKLQAGGLHRFLFGSHWRNTWTTPIKIEFHKLDSSANDLTLETSLARIHEGIITRSFLLNGKDGSEYTFTPYNQDSVSSFPSELSILLPQNIVTDQVSTLNPFAQLIVVPILKAVDLPYRETQIAAFPKTIFNNVQLAEDRENLGILEGHLHIPPTNVNPHSYELFETTQMLEVLENNLHCRVDELQYLKARLIDILLGDWDRSMDQWLWLRTQKNTDIIWKPIPHMHRQAFVRLDGILPTIADLALPQLEECGNNISNIDNLTLTGRNLDRRLLLSYPRQTWDSLASIIQAQVTDSVILQAISNLPVPILDEEGKSLFRLLQTRRAQLSKAAIEFYKLSSAYVEIYGSKNADRVEIRRVGRHMVSVVLYDKTDTSRIPVYQRLFHDDFTKEIRILLLRGDDIVNIDGEENSAIKIIVDGGEGQNEFVDKSKSRSLFTSINPFSPSRTVLYDNNPASRIKAGSNTQVIRDWPMNHSTERTSLVDVSHRNWGSEWGFNPWLDLNPDDGIFIGGGPVYTKYGYRTEPYAEQIGVRAGVATKTGRYRLDATGEFRDWFHGIRTFLQFHASQLDLSNFLGLGNETRYSQSLDDANFYKVDQRQIYLRAALDFPIVNSTSLTIGGTLKLIDNNPKPGTLLDALQLSYYNKSLTFINLTARIQTDSRDEEQSHAQGTYAKAEISFLPKVFDNKNSFYKLKAEIRKYVTLTDLKSTTIAFRLAGEEVFGSHPFFESAFLGGNESLRGFERQRFTGDASLLGGVEIRTCLAKIPFIVPLWAGISGFMESGRVFLSGEQSGRWHNIIGGGIWFSFIKPEYIANLSLARSEDKYAFYATWGFMF